MSAKEPQILVLGLPRSGTTYLYFKIFHSLGSKVRTLFEPSQLTEEDKSSPFLAKSLVTRAFELKSFQNVATKVLILRDPRDWWVSRVLYSPYVKGEFSANEQQVARALELAVRKEADPRAVSLSELATAMGAEPAQEIQLAKTLYRRLQAVIASCPDMLVVRYEDLLQGNKSRLEQHLGFELQNTVKLGNGYQHVRRRARFGDWKNWFTEADVELLKPCLDPYVQEHGYGTWLLASRPIIQPEHASVYLERLIAQRRKLDGLPPLETRR